MRKLWAFSGIDGAGKTTQIEMLIERLRREGRPVRRIWARGGYTPLFEFAKGLLRRTSSRALPKPGRSKARTQQFRRPLIRKVWLLISIFDLFLYYGVYVRWLRLTGRIVVSDRWVMDTELDFELNFAEEHVPRWLSWRLLKAFMPRPAEHFVFLIPVEESLRRSEEKNEPFPDDAEVLAKRLAFYRASIGQGAGREMNGMLKREEIHDQVAEHCGIGS